MFRSFDPDFVLVSAGFDAAVGHDHPIGKQYSMLMSLENTAILSENFHNVHTVVPQPCMA
jgi:hypothetical protein